MNKKYSLHRKKSGAAWRATYCYSGQVYHFATGESDLQRAHAKCLAHQPGILALIKTRIESKEMEVAVSGDDSRAQGYSARAASSQPAALNFDLPAPKGSFREKIQDERALVVNSVRNLSRKREVMEAEAHLYKALGVEVDLPVSKIDRTTGARVGAYFSNRDHFHISGPHSASSVRRLLLPIVQRAELNPEFLAALDRVSKGGKSSK